MFGDGSAGESVSGTDLPAEARGAAVWGVPQNC